MLSYGTNTSWDHCDLYVYSVQISPLRIVSYRISLNSPSKISVTNLDKLFSLCSFCSWECDRPTTWKTQHLRYVCRPVCGVKCPKKAFLYDKGRVSLWRYCGWSLEQITWDGCLLLQAAVSSCLWCYDVIPHWFVPRVTVILMHFKFATAATTSSVLISRFDRYQKQKRWKNQSPWEKYVTSLRVCYRKDSVHMVKWMFVIRQCRPNYSVISSSDSVYEPVFFIWKVTNDYLNDDLIFILIECFQLQLWQ